MNQPELVALTYDLIMHRIPHEEVSKIIRDEDGRVWVSSGRQGGLVMMEVQNDAMVVAWGQVADVLEDHYENVDTCGEAGVHLSTEASMAAIRGCLLGKTDPRYLIGTTEMPHNTV